METVRSSRSGRQRIFMYSSWRHPSLGPPGKSLYRRRPQEERQVQSVHLAIHEMYMTIECATTTTHNTRRRLFSSFDGPAWADGTVRTSGRPAGAAHESRKVFSSFFHTFRRGDVERTKDLARGCDGPGSREGGIIRVLNYSRIPTPLLKHAVAIRHLCSLCGRLLSLKVLTLPFGTQLPLASGFSLCKLRERVYWVGWTATSQAGESMSGDALSSLGLDYRQLSKVLLLDSPKGRGGLFRAESRVGGGVEDLGR